MNPNPTTPAPEGEAILETKGGDEPCAAPVESPREDVKSTTLSAASNAASESDPLTAAIIPAPQLLKDKMTRLAGAPPVSFEKAKAQTDAAQSLSKGTTETPETDAAEFFTENFDYGLCDSSVARTLERRLAALQRENAVVDEANVLLTATLEQFRSENKGMREEITKQQRYTQQFMSDALDHETCAVSILQREIDRLRAYLALKDRGGNTGPFHTWREAYRAAEGYIHFIECDTLRAELSALREDMAREHAERVRLMQVGDLQEKDIAALKTECEGLNRELNSAVALGDALMDEKRGMMDMLAAATARAEAAEALVETCRKALEEDGLQWLKAKLSEAGASLRAREQMAQALKSGSDASWAAAAKLHPTTASAPPFTKADRLRASAAQTRISAKCLRDVTMFRRIIDALAALPVAGTEGKP